MAGPVVRQPTKVLPDGKRLICLQGHQWAYVEWTCVECVAPKGEEASRVLCLLKQEARQCGLPEWHSPSTPVVEGHLYDVEGGSGLVRVDLGLVCRGYGDGGLFRSPWAAEERDTGWPQK